MAEREINRKLHEQKLAIVRTVAGTREFEELLSSAADEDWLLYSWNIYHNDTIIAIFYPATEQAKECRRKGQPAPI